MVKDSVSFPQTNDADGARKGSILNRLSGLSVSGASSTQVARHNGRYPAIFKHAAIGMALLNHKGCIAESNAAFQAMLGYSEEELIGHEFAEFLDMDDAASASRMDVATSLLEHSAHQTEIRFLRKDNRSFWGYLALSPLPKSNGGKGLSVALVMNIDVHNKTEEDLRSVTRALRTLSECNQTLLRLWKEPDLLKEICRIIVDVGGYSMAWVGYAENDSKKAVRPAAYAGNEHGFLEKLDITWADKKKGLGPTGTAIRENETIIVRDIASDKTIPGWRKEALRRTFVSAIALPLQVQDKTLAALTIYADSTDVFDNEEVALLSKLADNLSYGISNVRLREERERAEKDKEEMQKQLVQAQKMEALGRLAGGIAHDFNNLLTEIIGYSELMLTSFSPDDPRYQDIDTIKSAGERAGVLTKQLLAFSRRQVVQPKSLRINDIVSDMQQMLRRMIGEDVETITYLDPAVDCIKADRSQIEQVILNLVINARHAMPRGGKLTIGTEFVILEGYDCKLMPEARPGNFVCLTVADTGTGMDEETIEHIFDPFFSTKGPSKGSGLGLSVVYGIVKQHEGWIRVSSQLNEGTRFKVYLPTFSGEPDEKIKKDVPLHTLRGNGERILLVEDEEGVRKFALDALSRNGYEVFVAATARDALEIFNEQQDNLELVITDVVLPDLSGNELLEQLEAEYGKMPILVTSGHTFENPQIAEMIGDGLPFLQKPYSVPELLDGVKGALADSGT
ncbi:MAG: PAS domain S-box protein [Candidatus Pacebacteria bacterium]|nr:PAS domain S-box protein [Candidatus Paceibacterota bacterium]